MKLRRMSASTLIKDLDSDVDQIQESNKTKCSKYLNYIKNVSFFRLDVGIFHDGSMSYIPAASLLISFLLMAAVVFQTLNIALTLNATIGEAIWKTTT